MSAEKEEENPVHRIPALRRLKQEDLKSGASPGYVSERLTLKQINSNRRGLPANAGPQAQPPELKTNFF